MSYNIFMLFQYGYNIALDVNNNITYNSESSLLLNDDLGMLYAEIKDTICRGFGWIYNDIDAK